MKVNSWDIMPILLLLLAERWSLDPGRIDERLLERERGVAGEPPWR